MELLEEIQQLITLETEGDYWDFKEAWHDNEASLLHDIICMANNQVNRDAYIIIGVSDSKSPDGVKIKGVPADNRKDQQQLVTFLRDKKFAGGVRPSVYLQTLRMKDENAIERQIDVIIIGNSSKTPFFLAKDFGNKDHKKVVRAGYIYTRIRDTNTPIDSIADMDKIEYLWRKRFGIDLSAVERLLHLLDSPDDWAGDLHIGNIKYHKYSPEFQIHINEIEDQTQFFDNDIIKNIADHCINKNSLVCDAVITYHTTVLYHEHILYLDGARLVIPLPLSSSVYMDSIVAQEPSVTYLYLNMDSIPGKLFNCFALVKNNWYAEKWTLPQGVAFLRFQDEAERIQFESFAWTQLKKIEAEYAEVLRKKQYTRTPLTESYYRSGWSKASEIKAWHLYEKFEGITGRNLLDKVPNLSH